MNVSNTEFRFNFIIALVGLSYLLIYLISNSSRRSYIYRRAIISIIRRFSFIKPSLTRYSYSKYKSVYTIIRIGDRFSYLVTFLSIVVIVSLVFLKTLVWLHSYSGLVSGESELPDWRDL